MSQAPPNPDDTLTPIGDGQVAEATFQPESVAELQAIVRDAAARGQAVYPRGGATALDYGEPPARPGIAVNLNQLNQVVDYPAADMTITVEGGLTLASIRQITGEQNQRLAIEAPAENRATLGGIFSTAWTGPRRFGWGRPRDQIIGIGFVSATGELIRGGGRVVKNVAGYDFPKLLTGSLGTLGIITELTLKVNPQPEASAVASLSESKPILTTAALDALNLSGTRPIALELLDTQTKQRQAWTLMVGFEGNPAAVDWQVERLRTELGQTPFGSTLDPTAVWAFWTAQTAFEPGQTLGPLAWRASFAPSVALRFLAEVGPDLWWTRVHAGNGIVRGFSLGVTTRAAWLAEVVRLRAATERLGGALILTQCPTAWKAELGVWGPRRPDWAMMERVKAALDPARTLNPGRFVGTI